MKKSNKSVKLTNSWSWWEPYQRWLTQQTMDFECRFPQPVSKSRNRRRRRNDYYINYQISFINLIFSLLRILKIIKCLISYRYNWRERSFIHILYKDQPRCTLHNWDSILASHYLAHTILTIIYSFIYSLDTDHYPSWIQHRPISRICRGYPANRIQIHMINIALGQLDYIFYKME